MRVTDIEKHGTRSTLIGNTTASQPNDNDGTQSWTSPWIKGDAMTAHALYYFDTMTTLGQQYMRGQEVTFSGPTIEGLWTYSPIKYWPQQGYLDFYAQYPSDEMLAAMRISVEYATPDDGLTLPGDMPEDDLVETASGAPLRTRGGGVTTSDVPAGISSLRLWHEDPSERVISFRLKMHPHSLLPPNPTDEPLQNSVPILEYDDAHHQPDLLYAHHPHLSKPSVDTRVDYSFTHTMMGVRFWLKGYDMPEEDGDGDNPAGGGGDATSRERSSCQTRADVTPVYTASRFKNISNFTVNSISFGPVYIAGECVAYDNTNWAQYYATLNEATHHSDEPVKLRYVWKYADSAPTYKVRLKDGTESSDYTMAPPYGGCEQRTPVTGKSEPTLIDPAYPLPEGGITDIFTQRCDYSLTDYPAAHGAFSIVAARSDEGWHPNVSVPLLPVLDMERGVGAEQSAFIIPPQMFLADNPYIKVTYTITEAVDGDEEPETLTFTTEPVPIPMDGGSINVEDGEILDLYFTFDLDGDDHFRFIVDAKINPWLKGGEQEEEWRNW